MAENLVERNKPQLTLAGAKLMLEAAENQAARMGLNMDIAVVDDGGNLLAFHRMLGAKITGIDVAVNKAYTAAGTRLPTANYAKVAKPEGGAFGIHVSNQGRFMIFPGGLPVFIDGQPVGGIGASSGTGEQDAEVCQAGIDALLKALDQEP